MQKNNESKTDIMNMSLAEIVQWIDSKPTVKFLIILLLVLFACNTTYECGTHVGEIMYHIING